jgi:RNA polymerase sigma factor (sigma-70 family)
MSAAFPESVPDQVSKAPPLTAAQQELFDAHISDALGLSSNLYRRFLRNRINHERDDFDSLALEALFRAAKKWDSSRGVLLWTLFNTIFRFMINESYKSSMMIKRKCPVKIKRLEQSVDWYNKNKTEENFSLKDTLAVCNDRQMAIIEAVDQAKFLEKIAKKLDSPMANRNWTIVKDYFMNDVSASQISKKYKFCKSRVNQILNDTIKKIRKIAESSKNF